jgi:hypothetical protein
VAETPNYRYVLGDRPGLLCVEFNRCALPAEGRCPPDRACIPTTGRRWVAPWNGRLRGFRDGGPAPGVGRAIGLHVGGLGRSTRTINPAA